MSFKDYDKKTYIADTARDFAARRISKRDFLRRWAWPASASRPSIGGLARHRPSARQSPDRHRAEAQTPET